MLVGEQFPRWNSWREWLGVKDWACWIVVINVTHWALLQQGHPSNVHTGPASAPALPPASDPGAGPREDTGVYETQSRLVCIRLMALLWTRSEVLETVFLKSPNFLCALHLVQE